MHKKGTLNQKNISIRPSIDSLKKISCFGAISSGTIEFLINEGKLFEVMENDFIFRAGEKSDGFFIILSGEVSFVKHHNGTKAFIRNYNSGEPIGVVGMITLQDRVGDAYSMQASQLLYISSSLFHRLYEKNSQDYTILLMNIMRDMARGLKTVDDIIVGNQSESVNRPFNIGTMSM